MLILLGPQRYKPMIGEALETAGVTGPVAVVSCGWQERELEMHELAQGVENEMINLELHRRAEQFFSADPDFRAAHRQHQSRVRQLQEIYRLRLDHTLGAVHHLMAQDDTFPEDVLERETDHAMAQVRELDRHHLAHIRGLQEEFLQEWNPMFRSAGRDHYYELSEQLQSCEAVVIAGGHLAVLLNRMRLFDIKSLIEGKPAVAFSAGAMVLGERVVLFHDSPPQGRGYAEVFESGLGLFNDLIPLPHANQRLMLDNPTRVAMFAGRFNDAQCVTFETGSRIDRIDETWRPVDNVHRLTLNGAVEELT